MDKSSTNKGRIGRLIEKATTLWTYLYRGIWSDPRKTWWLKILRTLNLSVQSFMDRGIQTQACALTYRTLLAIVPAMALLLAIGRGFGFQTMLQEELMHIFPAQQQAIEMVINFVDSYLKNASGGLFVGIGLLFLLWTLISLLGNVESTFNFIWGQKEGRSFWRKVSDYTAILLILPVLLICAGGMSLMLSSTLNELFSFSFLTPLVSIILKGSSWLVTWLFFTAAFMLVPNTRVKFVNAFISGVISGTGFLILQWLFVTGTVYVTKYNAIYGSLAFLPLLMLWLQLVWVIVLAGAVICYSSQNVFAYNLSNEVSNISPAYLRKVTIAVTSVFAHRFVAGKPVVTAYFLMEEYELPARLVTDITDHLVDAGILNRVVVEGEKDLLGFQLAVEPSTLTVASLCDRLSDIGAKEFIPEFNTSFVGVDKAIQSMTADEEHLADATRLCDIEILPPKSERTSN